MCLRGLQRERFFIFLRCELFSKRGQLFSLLGKRGLNGKLLFCLLRIKLHLQLCESGLLLCDSGIVLLLRFRFRQGNFFLHQRFKVFLARADFRLKLFIANLLDNFRIIGLVDPKHFAALRAFDFIHFYHLHFVFNIIA